MAQHRIRITGVETCTTTRDLVVETDDPHTFLQRLRTGEMSEEHPSFLSVTEKECSPEGFEICEGQVL